MNKKKLLSLALVLILIASLSFGTLAWFSDTKEVQNDFMIAGSGSGDPEDIFSVEVWENVEGKDGHKETTYDGFTYENILPGDNLKKEVYIENTGSYAQYMRVIITISDAKAWIAALGADFDPTTLLVGFDPTIWNHGWNNLSEATEMPEELIYVLHHIAPLAPDDTVDVFKSVKIPTTLTQAQAAAFGADGFSIDVKAQAVQTENVVPEGTPAGDEAYAAFRFVGMDISEVATPSKKTAG